MREPNASQSGPEDEPPPAAALEPDLDAVYRAHAHAVAGLARRLLAGVGDADDVVHDVFLVVHRRLGELRDSALVWPWLRRITLHVVKEQRRKARWRPWLVRNGELPDAPSTDASPERQLASAEELRALEVALSRLREDHREVLVLFELEQVSGNELAELFDVPVGTIWVWLHRARAALARELARVEQQGEPR